MLHNAPLHNQTTNVYAPQPTLDVVRTTVEKQQAIKRAPTRVDVALLLVAASNNDFVADMSSGSDIVRLFRSSGLG
jgi:hypothetical protein